MGKVIKVLLQSFFDSSGVNKMRAAVEHVVGNVGDLSGALNKLGTLFGSVGNLAGGFLSNILKGGVWGAATEGIKYIIQLVGEWRDKEKKAAEEVEKAAKEAFAARMKAVNEYAAAVEKAHAAADKTTNEHLRLINAEVDATNNLKKALLELEAVRAKKRGDTDAAARAERELSGLDAEAAEAKMMNMMEAAANKRYDAQAYLDKLGAGREQAQAAADAESKRIAEEIAKVRDRAAKEEKGSMAVGQSVAGTIMYAATDEDRKAAADAAEAAYRQGDAYKELSKRLAEANGKVADYSSKISEAQKTVESLTADEKTLATNFDAMLASNTAKAEKAALDSEERLKATQRNIEEEKRKSLERQADAEWKAYEDRKRMEQEEFEENQRRLKLEEVAKRKAAHDELSAAIKSQRERMAALKTSEGERASVLAAAESKVQRAWQLYRDPKGMAAQLREERADAKAQEQYEKDFKRLSRRRNWREATNLSVRDEAVRRVAIAKEEEAAAKKAALETAENTKKAAEKLQELSENLEKSLEVN